MTSPCWLHSRNASASYSSWVTAWAGSGSSEHAAASGSSAATTQALLTGRNGSEAPGTVRGHDDGGVARRARHDGRGPGAGLGAVAGADPAGRRELPDLGRAGAG